MARIGFCGLGLMGRRMARRLADAGHDMVVWNRTRERADELESAGARVAATPAGAARDRDVVITMLADPAAFRDVLFREEGLAAGLSPGTTLVDMSTVGRDAVLDAAGRLPEGVAFLDAPVVGSTARAEAGGLTILVGGPEDAFERVRPVLEVLGRPNHVGGLGAGAAMKLVMNSTLGVVIVGIAEALALGAALGLEEGAVLDALQGSYLGGMVEAKRRMIETGEYPPQFRMTLAAKDLRLAEEAGPRLPGVTLAREAFEAAAAAGLGDRDYAALIEFLRREP